MDDGASGRGTRSPGGGTPGASAPRLSESTAGYWDHYVNVHEGRAEGDDSTCLRPLGRCDLGGACELCLHNPDNRTAAVDRRD